MTHSCENDGKGARLNSDAYSGANQPPNPLNSRHPYSPNSDHAGCNILLGNGTLLFITERRTPCLTNRRVPMHHSIDILRLHHEDKLSERAITRSFPVSSSTVSEVLTRSQLAGLSWPLPSDCDELQSGRDPVRQGAGTSGSTSGTGLVHDSPRVAPQRRHAASSVDGVSGATAAGVISPVSFAIAIKRGTNGYMSRCASSTARGTSCLSTMPGLRCAL